MTLQASIGGNLYWGGMSGQLTLTNTGDFPLSDWSYTFVTRQKDVQVWSSTYDVVDLGDGTYEVTVAPPSWGATIPAGGSLNLSFNAKSVGIPNSGTLTDDMFFVDSVAPTPQPEPEVEAELPTPTPTPEPEVIEPEVEAELPTPTPEPEVIEPEVEVEQPAPEPEAPTNTNLDVDITETGGWGTTVTGNVTVTNNTGSTLPKGWSVTFTTENALISVSNFDYTQTQLSDGSYEVTLTPKSWAGSLGVGSAYSSYYQATEAEVAAPAPAPAPTPVAPEEPEIIDEIDTPETETPTPEVSPDVTSDGTVTIDYESPNGTTDKRVVTYFEEWGIYSRDVNLSDVDGQSMTHMNYSFFDVKSDGSITLFDEFAALQKRFTQGNQVRRTFTTDEYSQVDASLIDAYENSGRYTVSQSADAITVQSVPVGWNGVGNNDAGNFEQLRRFKELNPEVNLGFALGGWTLSDEFSTAYSTQAGRDKFVSETVRIFETYDFFNVVDFDWEYPGGGGKSGNASSPNDGANFELVLSDLDAALDNLSAKTGQDYEVSIATAGGYEKLANLNLPGIDPYVDFYNVMTYDFHGGWENSTGHQAAMTGDANNYDVTGAVDVFEDAGIELSKVVMGAPAYTRAWGDVSDGGTFGYQQQGNSASATGSFEAGVYDYKDIVDDVITGQRKLFWDDDNKAAFVYDGDEWSSMETTATIAGKAAYIEEKGLGGMMFWALSNDGEGELSLVEAADDLLRQGASYSEVVDRAPEFDTIVGGNGDFSMSDFIQFA